MKHSSLDPEIVRQVLDGIALGEADIRAGRVISHEEAKKRLARWLKPDKPTER